MTGWKATKSKRQNIKKTKLALIVLALLMGILILAQVAKFTQTLFKPWKEVTSKAYRWDEDFNINVLIYSKSISLISYSPKNEKITIINIPDETYLNVPQGFGMWQVRSIYPLGGDKLLKDSISSFFGLPVDGFLNFSGKFFEKDPKHLVDELKKNPFSLFNSLPNLRTDLTLFELIKFKMGLSKVRFDKINEINLEKTGLLEKNKLLDGTDVYTLDPVRLDSILSDLVDPQIRTEHKTIAIFNSTNHPNLAQKAARVITNIGGDVIIVSNGQTKYAKTQVAGEKSKTLKRIRQIFNGNGRIDPKDQDLISSRAQINLFLGEDYFNSF